ncbi:protein kinase [Actinomycetaceae bacterium WB03_NA08]|uniref:Protein kinase n=1 Tax=Scrofimicrobium canadense TaxID=2652290 RepID=A0A6N7WAW0_9ACTO|nr:protein kinase [Scrofimicrobium canadense]MSS85308.1 protein kinase [Scrofimicrobium canadense]
MALIYPQGYTYIDHIASHDFVSVVKALSPTGEEVALKVADNQGSVHRRFEREIKAMLDVAGQSTMPILDHDDTYTWYTMPLASKTLNSERVPVSRPEDALTILQTVADSLRPLHAQVQVHRDLKPENILFLSTEAPGRWVVADFGIVRNAPGLTTAPLTVRGSLTGTRAWAAPEQFIDAHDTSPATDVYSAGLLMGWMLTGKAPVPGVPYSALGSLTSTILRATEQDQHRRFVSMDDFLVHFKKHMHPTKAKLDSLFDEAQYTEIHGYLLERPDQLPPLVRRMITLDEEQLLVWSDDDLSGLVSTCIQISEDLGEHFNSIGRDNVDRYLVWLLSVCDALNNDQNLDELGTVLAAQMRATERLDQWTPRRATVGWIDRQSQEVETIAREALHTTDTWSYFAEEARQRWSSKRRTELVRDLADS